MPIYDYKAKDRAGSTVTGSISAPDERSAADAIRERGQMPMDIRAARQSRPQSKEAGSAFARYLIYPLWTGVNIKMLAFFYRQLATLLNSGMSLSEALHTIESRTPGRLRAIVGEMRDQTAQGHTMSETLERYPKIFSNLQIALVRVGERGGLLDQMVDRIASYLEYELGVRKLIMKATVYPIVTFVFAILCYICVPHVELAVTRGMGPFMAIVGPQLEALAFGAIGVIIFLKLVFQFATVRLIWDSIKVYVPIVGQSARKVALSRFSRALAVLYAAGIATVESVEVASDACANLYIARGVKYAIPAIMSGQGLTESLTRTRVISPMVLDMLSIGERAGSTDASLQKVADYMDDELDASIHKIGIALFVVMLLAVGVVVGYIAIEFYQRLYGNISKMGGA